VTALAELLVAVDDPSAWRRIGLTFDGDTTQVGQVTIRVSAGRGGVVSWGLAGMPETTAAVEEIDGLPIHVVEPPTGAAPPVHPLGAVRVDHAVVFTDSLERTCGALAAATGCELKRVREAGPVRQGFHRLGEVIAEVVESDRATASSYWGFVLEVADLDAACALLGPDVVGEPRNAVQPGQRIATIRSGIGLGVPVALISGRPRP
jgi:hypothetical protein